MHIITYYYEIKNRKIGKGKMVGDRRKERRWLTRRVRRRRWSRRGCCRFGRGSKGDEVVDGGG